MFALLTGQAPYKKHRRCDPTVKGFLDNCDFIWKEYQKAGYVTLYAEDQKDISAFNIGHKGFKKPPTDHYFRPFVLAAEKLLPVQRWRSLAFCLGKSIYIDHIVIYALKLVSIHEPDPFFGLINVNSLRDKQLSSGPNMDKRIANSFLEKLENASANDTILIYFSDSGTRFEDNEVGESLI